MRMTVASSHTYSPRIMTNTVLHATSWLMFAAHVLALALLAAPSNLLRLVYLLGPVTSIWNHAATGRGPKWLDRAAMAAGLALDVRYFGLWNPPLLAAVAAYTGAKTVQRHSDGVSVALHCVAHAAVTVAHWRMLLLFAAHDTRATMSAACGFL